MARLGRRLLMVTLLGVATVAGLASRDPDGRPSPQLIQSVAADPTSTAPAATTPAPTTAATSAPPFPTTSPATVAVTAPPATAAPTTAAPSSTSPPTRATTRTTAPRRQAQPTVPPSTVPSPPTTLNGIPTGTPPASVPALDITAPSGHVGAIFPILSGVGAGVVLLILAIQAVLTRPRRRGWTL